MELKYNIVINSNIYYENIKRIINQIYKLLPMRQEGADWQKPLETIIEELAGMNRLLINQQKNLLIILCKLQGLFELTQPGDFLLYRRIIFECLSLLGELEKEDANRS